MVFMVLYFFQKFYFEKILLYYIIFMLNNVDFAFYHIPKCGGSTLREFFKKMLLNKGYKESEIYIPDRENNNIMNNADFIKMIPILNDKKVLLAHINNNLYPKINAKFNITCIRNPIHRFISSFNHFNLLDNPKLNLEKLYLNERVLFDTLCINCYSCPSREWFRNNIFDYNYIIIFENLEEDLKQLSSNIFDIQKELDLPHVDPGKINKFNTNFFKLDMTFPLHMEMYQHIKGNLKNDIDLYNKICLFRKLNDKIIK